MISFLKKYSFEFLLLLCFLGFIWFVVDDMNSSRDEYHSFIKKEIISSASFDLNCPAGKIGVDYNEDQPSYFVVNACGNNYRYIPASNHCYLSYYSSMTVKSVRKRCTFVNASLGINQ